MRLSNPRGFTLIEALVAAALVATAIVTLAHLIGIGVRQHTAARRATTALVLAQSKLEELRSLPWAFAADGSRVSSERLAASPASSLTSNQEGWSEALDRFGALAADDDVPVYRRRWAVALLDAADVDTIVMQVCVASGQPDSALLAADACVFGMRTRKP